MPHVYDRLVCDYVNVYFNVTISRQKISSFTANILKANTQTKGVLQLDIFKVYVAEYIKLHHFCHNYIAVVSIF
jgi:hypothetical protein